MELEKKDIPTDVHWEQCPAEEPIYWPENSDEPYTKADFIRLCDGNDDLGYTLFLDCSWQCPETILDEEGGLAAYTRSNRQLDEQIAKQVGSKPNAFFDSNGVLRDWNTADPMPSDWTGFAMKGDKVWFIGRENQERSFTPLSGKTFLASAKEAVRRGIM